MVKYEKEYRHELDKYLHCGEDNIFFYWKGRVALYALLKAMDIGPGDEVIVQGYTCVVVPNAILYLGATPVYVDIDLTTYNMNIDSLKSKISEKTRVIICQNTYGLSSNLETIQEIADQTSEEYGHTVYTLEDCTHGFGGTYHGKPNGTSCDASFFSTQWNKPFTTGVGGFSAVHNKNLIPRLKELEAEKVEPGTVEKAELKPMYFTKQYIINDITYWSMVNLYRWLSRKNLVLGSSSGEEVEGINMPEGFFKNQSSVQFQKGIKSLKKLESVNTLRKKNARIYTDFLKSIGKNHVDEALFDDHIFIRYPLLVNSREVFKEKAEKSKIVLGEWFEGPIYPACDSLDIWKLDTNEIPNGMYASEKMVNLPTDVKEIGKILDFLETNKSVIC